MKHKSIIYFILMTIVYFVICDGTDVVHYYMNKSQYTEYQAVIVDFKTTGSRYRDYYCIVEYYETDGAYCTADYIKREYGDKEGSQIIINIASDGRIYRKGYIKYMSHMRISIIYFIFLVYFVLRFVDRKRKGGRRASPKMESNK